jgi:peptide/nickel transport system permease protein
MSKVFDRFKSGELKARIADLRYTLHLLRRNPLVVIGSVMSIFFIILALTANLIVNPATANQFNFANSYGWNNPYFSWGSGIEIIKAPPIHWLGTDGFGRDLLQMIILAIPLDLGLAFFITLGALAIGVSIGALAGYIGGVFDEAIMRITDIFFAFPMLLLAIVFAAIFGRTIQNLAIAVLLVWWPTYVRLVRGQVLSEKEKTYVEALKALGASRPKSLDTTKAQTNDVLNRLVELGGHNRIMVELTKLVDRVETASIDGIAIIRGHLRILFRHIIPNSIYPLLVQATLDIGGVILTFSALMFLGFSPSPALPELGNLASDGISHIFTAPWLILFPGLTIVLIALAFNLVGDGLRDVLDPRLRR